METLTSKTVEQMSEPFSEPSVQENFSSWAERSIAHSTKEKKEREKTSGPREINLKGRSDEEKEFIEAVGQKDESAKESQRDSAKRDAANRNEQRSDDEKSTAGESTNSRVAPKEQGKLTQAEADGYWRQISAGKDLAWQKEVGPHLAKVLGEIGNEKAVMQALAAQPELVRNARNVDQLRAAVEQVSTAHKSVSEVMRQAAVRHPDAVEKILAATNDVMTKAPMFMKSFINDSEVLGELLYTLADQITLTNLLETAKTNPGKALRVLRDMELDVKKALSNAPEMRPRPRAPRPPTELAARGAAGDDDRTNGEMSFRDVDRKMRQMYAHGR